MIDSEGIVNVPVDRELKFKSSALMLTEGLTWEQLIERLLLRCVESDAQYPKLLERHPPR